MDAIDLAQLDLPKPRTPDPSIWDANLKALSSEAPEAARQLKTTHLPADYRPVTALDGFPTYLVGGDSQSPIWLAGMAAPRIRAEALLAREAFTDKNPALPSIAAGAELAHLLTNLSAQQAVYVLEDDLIQLAAVLRCVDFSKDIATGRCIVLPPESPQNFLEDILERYSGLLPPATIVAMPTSDQVRLGQVQRICEAVTRRSNRSRLNRLSQIQSSAAGTPVEVKTNRRLAIVALDHNANHHHLATQLKAAAHELGWQACACIADNSRSVGPVPHYEALAALDPDITICIGQQPDAMPLRSGNHCCFWHLHAERILAETPSDDTTRLAASPQVANALLQGGISGERVIDFHWACTAENADQSVDLSTSEHSSASGCVILMDNLPDMTPTSCGIEQPTHKRLWACAIQTASGLLGSPEFYQPVTILRQAERATGIELGDRGLSERMVRIIEHILIPAVALQTIPERLALESYEVVTIGRGWEQCSFTMQKPFTELSAGIPIVAAVFAGRTDPLSPDIFRAIERNWPLVLHNPWKIPLTRRLGGILLPEQHYEEFADLKQLAAVLESIRGDRERYQLRCERTREYVRAHHTYAQRLTELVKRLGLE